jgi:DNA-binding NarL/FixJ family response regulator
MEIPPLILHIDAHREDREHYTQLLRTSSRDFVVLHVTTGQAGLAVCKRRAIDCVVLELDLPDMSGFELLRQLVPYAQDPEIAVIVLTRISDHHFLEAAIETGAQAAFHKTTTSADILHRAVLRGITTVQNRKRLAHLRTACSTPELNTRI